MGIRNVYTDYSAWWTPLCQHFYDAVVEGGREAGDNLYGLMGALNGEVPVL